MGLNIVELAYLKLLNEKVNGNTPHYIKIIQAAKSQSYFTEEELYMFLNTNKTQTREIIREMKKSGIIKKEGKLYQVQEIERIIW